MADFAHLDPAAADDAVEAEPDECSRRALICLPPCLFFVALVAFSWLREELMSRNFLTLADELCLTQTC
jgi:hypothetical protein